MSIKDFFKSLIKKISLTESKIVQRFSRSIWFIRITLYFIIFACVIILSYIIFNKARFLHTDVDSARYMLSALIQGEFAVVALVITLSIIAVQLAASSYSVRLIDAFRKTPDLWILVGIYGINIFYGLGVLKLIEKVNPQVNSLSNLEAHISFSYYLGIFAFVSLVPYIWNTLNLLKPSTVIEMLAEEITKQNILLEREKLQKHNEKDPLQPIIDIIRSSLMKYDYETVRAGLRIIGERTNLIFNNEILKTEEETEISKHIFSHLNRFGKLVVSRKDEDSTMEVLKIVYEIGVVANEKKLETATCLALKNLDSLGMIAVENKLESSTARALELLKNIGRPAILSILNVGIKSVNNDEVLSSVLSILALKNMGMEAVEQKNKKYTEDAVVYIWWIGERAAANEDLFTTTTAVESLQTILKILPKDQEFLEISQLAEEYIGKLNEALNKFPLGEVFRGLGEILPSPPFSNSPINWDCDYKR